jgi:hypothetical protein
MGKFSKKLAHQIFMFPGASRAKESTGSGLRHVFQVRPLKDHWYALLATTANTMKRYKF